VKLGETVKLAYVDQSRDDLKPDETVWQAISGGTDVMIIGKREINSAAPMSAASTSRAATSRRRSASVGR
jgi:ATPase subunit of ABC transporter with duplicated ATPase domains